MSGLLQEEVGAGGGRGKRKTSADLQWSVQSCHGQDFTAGRGFLRVESEESRL